MVSQCGASGWIPSALWWDSWMRLQWKRLSSKFLQFSLTNIWSKDSLASIVTRLWTGQMRNCGSICNIGKKFFSFPKHPDQLRRPLNLFNGYQGLIPWTKGCQGIKLTIHLHLLPRMRMSAATPRPSHMSSMQAY
jgi:hypothetical protein